MDWMDGAGDGYDDAGSDYNNDDGANDGWLAY